MKNRPASLRLPDSIAPFILPILISLKLWPSFWLANKVIKLSKKIFGKINYTPSYRATLVIFLAKNLKSLKAIKILCRSGYGQDAGLILRSMVNHLIEIAYISQDKENRSKDFWKYDPIFKQKIANVMKNDPEFIKKSHLLEGLYNQEPEIEDEFKSVKNKFSDQSGKIFKNWSNLTIEQMAQKVEGMIVLYNWVYRHLSAFEHPSTMGIGSYVLEKNKAKEFIRVEIGPSADMVVAVLDTAIALQLEIIKLVNKEFDLNINPEIGKIWTKLRSKRPTNQANIY